jgi:hypothetical protein
VSGGGESKLAADSELVGGAVQLRAVLRPRGSAADKRFCPDQTMIGFPSKYIGSSDRENESRTLVGGIFIQGRIYKEDPNKKAMHSGSIKLSRNTFCLFKRVDKVMKKIHSMIPRLFGRPVIVTYVNFTETQRGKRIDIPIDY